MKAFKGFNKDLTCRGFQYKVGETYEEEKAELCHAGFHACESPVECLQHYGPAKSVYHEVELEDVSNEKDNDTKRVGKKITIGEEIGIPEICRLTFEYIKDHCTNENNEEEGKPATAGEYGAATAGNRGAATAGEYGAATAGYAGAATAGNHGAATAGNRGAATAGKYGAATAGEYGAATAGEYGAATAGDSGAATAGNRGAATAGAYGAATAGKYGAATAGKYGAATAGDHGAATAGNRGAATAGEYGEATAGECGAATSRGKSATGKNGLSVSRGNNVRVKGGLGAVLVIAEDDESDYSIKEFATAIVDGKDIKEDTWYKLENGKLIEADE